MANIYLAATYGSMVAMQEAAKKLKDAGHLVTARWINGDEEGLSKEAAALMDVTDVDCADTVISFTLAPKSPHTGGGRHWEFGYAYARHKRNILVGPKGEHVFHWLPGIEHFDSLEEAMAAL